MYFTCSYYRRVIELKRSELRNEMTDLVAEYSELRHSKTKQNIDLVLQSANELSKLIQKYEKNCLHSSTYNLFWYVIYYI
jgi:vacuolar-type H+-ATPase subunit D/Vma8